MADNKKSALLYCDIIHTVEPLKDAEAGRLFKHFLAYINDLNPIAPDRLTALLFEPIKQTLKRDLIRWIESSDKKSESGRFGNLKRWNLDLYEEVISGKTTLENAEKIAKNRKKSQRDKKIANIAVSDSVSVSVSVSDNINKSRAEIFSIDFLKENFNDKFNFKICRDQKITPEKNLEMQNIFFAKIDRTEKFYEYKTVAACRYHYDSWLKIELSKEKQNGKSTSKTADTIAATSELIAARRAAYNQGISGLNND